MGDKFGGRLDLFEFILIVTSVIYAMAVAQILSGVGRLAQSEKTIRWFLPHSMWIAILFSFIFLVWWSIWEFRGLAWTAPKYFYMVVMPTSIYFSCSLLIPQRIDADEIDLEAHFYRIRTIFLSSFFVAALTAIIDGIVLVDETLWFPGRVGHAVILLSVVGGLFVENKWAQTAVAALVMLGLADVVVERLWMPLSNPL